MFFGSLSDALWAILVRGSIALELWSNDIPTHDLIETFLYAINLSTWSNHESISASIIHHASDPIREPGSWVLTASALWRSTDVVARLDEEWRWKLPSIPKPSTRKHLTGDPPGPIFLDEVPWWCDQLSCRALYRRFCEESSSTPFTPPFKIVSSSTSILPYA